ncbi:related to inorganic phosphate permease [Cephalotrichum gorgonifer]|uniref:Related to inorganic phosphate permease n=1 Tax=Cephalotrichum gorgonifer TaxID=2041049 RepID=A0AAE8SYL6_9PEZI|nr:related to inorganic phosphate permease [Cephalotrichum gorgonifer]
MHMQTPSPSPSVGASHPAGVYSRGESPPTDGTQLGTRAIFRHLTHPDDSYTPDGVYWADLPFLQRLAFINKVDREEAGREVKLATEAAKKNPLNPVTWYLKNSVLPGLGVGMKGYVLFSIGNLAPLFASTWPQCWGPGGKECDADLVASVAYLGIIGITIGQIVVGIIGDWIGRRWGLIQDAILMTLGLLLLTGSWGVNLQGWVVCYALALFIYGIGVGGEYPLTATSSMESAKKSGIRDMREDRLHRGRKVTLAFLMQGWGQFVNQAVLVTLLLAFNQGRGDPPYSAATTQWTFRLSFAIPTLCCLWLVWTRIFYTKDASAHLDDAKKKRSVTGYDVASLRHIVKNYGGRLLATSGTWFCNDVFFYGNKLFQGQFIAVISNNPDSVMVAWRWNLINIAVSLAGYYAAALLIDHKLYGRRVMMLVGFFMTFVMFLIPTFHFEYFVSPEGTRPFQAIYLLSSFFMQLGPNCVTFLVAGEVFPTPVRATAHGLSASVGKIGALLSSVLFGYIDTRTKFYVVPGFGLAGMLLTWLFLPDTTGLDLKEQERRWEYILAGREDEYQGVAVHPAHLSVWERMHGVGKRYDAGRDFEAKIEVFGAKWEAREDARRRDAGTEEVECGTGDENDGFNEDVCRFFRQRKEFSG